jgi:hypothetical protein
MAICKTKPFQRFARRNRLDDLVLRQAAESVQNGQADADLGGGVYKQRIARARQGKSGGYRTILVQRRGGDLVFVHGFAKSEKGNVTHAELEALKAQATAFSKLTPEQVRTAVESGAWVELEESDDDDDES